MIYSQKVEVISNEQLTSDIFEMIFNSEEIAKNAVVGQFVNIYCSDSAHLLPRPISICDISKCSVRIVYRAAGDGTKAMSLLKKGNLIDITGPVGNGYDIDYINSNFKNALLFGGGVGIPPMIGLSKALTINTDVFLGYRDEVFLQNDFSSNAKIHISTEDGSVGVKGNVLDALKESGIKGDIICACGPLPMLRALKEYAIENNIKAFFSLEERMACGVGACLGCVCKTVHKDSHSLVNNARVCVDGPVFDAQTVII